VRKIEEEVVKLSLDKVRLKRGNSTGRKDGKAKVNPSIRDFLFLYNTHINPENMAKIKGGDV
jgi:hypothetical protein